MPISYIQIGLGVLLGIVLSGLFPNLPKWFMQLGNNMRDYIENQNKQQDNKNAARKSTESE